MERLKAELELAWTATANAEAAALRHQQALAEESERVLALEGALDARRDDRQAIEAAARDVAALRAALGAERKQQALFARKAGEAAAHADGELRDASVRVEAAREEASSWRATAEALRERYEKARRALKAARRASNEGPDKELSLIHI